MTQEFLGIGPAVAEQQNWQNLPLFEGWIEFVEQPVVGGLLNIVLDVISLYPFFHITILVATIAHTHI